MAATDSEACASEKRLRESCSLREIIDYFGGLPFLLSKPFQVVFKPLRIVTQNPRFLHVHRTFRLLQVRLRPSQPVSCQRGCSTWSLAPPGPICA
jgi:hypothetical protein